LSTREKNMVLTGSGVNSPRLNKVSDALLPKPLLWAGLEKKPENSLLCGSKPQEDDEASELTRD